MDFAELAAGFREQLIGLGPSFFVEWFSSVGAQWVLHAGDGFEQALSPSGRLAWLVMAGGGLGQQQAQQVHGAFEADATQLLLMHTGDAQYQGARHVVGDGVHEQFLAHHVGALGAHDFHVQGGFDVAVIQFDAPAAVIQLGELLCGVTRCAGAGGGDPQAAGAEAFALEVDPL